MDKITERNMVRERVASWAVVQDLLEEERRESIRTSDLGQFLRYFAGLADAVNRLHGHRMTSGLVEMQDIFRRSRND